MEVFLLIKYDIIINFERKSLNRYVWKLLVYTRIRILGTLRVPCPYFLRALRAILYPFDPLLQPSAKMEKSTAPALPAVNALARRAFPHDCAVWFGRDPEEK